MNFHLFVKNHMWMKKLMIFL